MSWKLKHTPFHKNKNQTLNVTYHYLYQFTLLYLTSIGYKKKSCVNEGLSEGSLNHHIDRYLCLPLDVTVPDFYWILYYVTEDSLAI